jgi:nucleoside-diphosphate kinase
MPPGSAEKEFLSRWHTIIKLMNAKEREMERTLVLLKPDSVQRGLVGKIIARFEEKGFQISALKLLWMPKSQAEDLYSPHVGKSFYEPTVEYMTSGPIVAMVLEGEEAVCQIRLLMGATNPRDAAPGTVRGDFGERIDRNCVHGSDSPESAAREIPIFFTPEEIADYKADFRKWL